MHTKTRITSKEKARTKKKVGLAVYFTFIATFALCFGAQLWMIDVFNPKEEQTTPQTYSVDNNKTTQNAKRAYTIENNKPGQSQSAYPSQNTNYDLENDDYPPVQNSTINTYNQ